LAHLRFSPSYGPPPLSLTPAHRPVGPVAFGRPTWPSPLLPRFPPSSSSLGQAGPAPPSSTPGRASPSRYPSLVPWREADPPRPLSLPLLYLLPLPPPLSVTSAHRHQWCRHHFTIARSPPSPLAPIKAAQAVPHLTSPQPTPPSFPPLLRQSSPPSSAFNHCRAASSPGRLVVAHPPVRP
jgi:hypothetical protein